LITFLLLPGMYLQDTDIVENFK